jgi:hypothetical protein
VISSGRLSAIAICVTLGLSGACSDDSGSTSSLCETVQQSTESAFADRGGPTDPTLTNGELIQFLEEYADAFRSIRPFASTELAADVDIVVEKIEDAAETLPRDNAPADVAAFNAAFPAKGQVADARLRLDAWVEDACG